jgi:hypothetical protein
MSLILEALRKLEREKQSPDAGLVVVGHTPWTGGSPGRSRSVLVVLALALVAGGIGLGVWLGRAPGRAPTAPSTSTAAVTPPAQTPGTVPAPPASAALADTPAAAPTTTQPVEPHPTVGLPTTTGGASTRAESGGAKALMPAGTSPTPGSAGTPPLTLSPPVSPVRPDPARTARAVPETEPEVEREVPAAARASSRGELKLQAISQRDGHPIAVINERLVREGESFDGVLVVKIGKAEVEIEVAGRRRMLTF